MIYTVFGPISYGRETGVNNQQQTTNNQQQITNSQQQTNKLIRPIRPLSHLCPNFWGLFFGLQKMFKTVPFITKLSQNAVYL